MDIGEKFLAILVIVICLVVIFVAISVTPQKVECPSGTFWSYREVACIPGYRP